MKFFLLWFLLLSLSSNVFAQQPHWQLVPNRMSDERWAPAYCLLSGGDRAIIAGGYSYRKKRCVATIDLFDEHADRFIVSHARLTYPRDFAQANLLPDGRILISGGYSDIWASMNLCEIYDPAADRCQLLASKMHSHRELFQATILSDGSVLMTGGLDLWAHETVSTAEIFEPKSREFIPVENMHEDRFGHASCRLQNGDVLVVGGTHWNLHTHDLRVLNSAEIYDPSTQSFHTAGNMIEARDRPTATLLPNGHVLIFGGQGANGRAIETAEEFDPSTETFHTISSPTLEPRMAHNATALPNGRTVVTGGWDAATHATTNTALEFDPASGTFSPLPDLPFASLDAAQVTFADGSVLVAGGKTAVDKISASVDMGVLLAPTKPVPHSPAPTAP